MNAPQFTIYIIDIFSPLLTCPPNTQHPPPTSDLPPTQFRGISLFIINNESFHKMEGNQIVVKKLSNAVFSS